MLTDREVASIDRLLPEAASAGDPFRNYCYRLAGVAIATGARRIVEFGLGRGVSAMALLAALRVNGGGRLWSLEWNPQYGLSRDLEAGLDPALARYWTREHGVRAAERAKTFQDGPLDLVYCDSSHTYEDTVQEIGAWLPHLIDGGLFVFHDVEHHRGEVFRAIAEMMMRRDDLAIEYHHFPDVLGHGILQAWREPSGGAPSLTERLMGWRPR